MQEKQVHGVTACMSAPHVFISRWKDACMLHLRGSINDLTPQSVSLASTQGY